MRGAREVHAPRGTDLSCRGWPQEAAMRMLMNNLDPDVAERPDDLVVYGGTGRAARGWPSLHALVRTLPDPARDETTRGPAAPPPGPTTSPCWSGPAGRSASSVPMNGRPGSSSPTPTWSPTGPPGRSSAA